MTDVVAESAERQWPPAPPAWMLSLKTVSGDHDLDNIRLHNLQPREALTASFSLDTLLVAGSCTEGGDEGGGSNDGGAKGNQAVHGTSLLW